jgi:hypothetical protein
VTHTDTSTFKAVKDSESLERTQILPSLLFNCGLEFASIKIQKMKRDWNCKQHISSWSMVVMLTVAKHKQNEAKKTQFMRRKL